MCEACGCQMDKYAPIQYKEARINLLEQQLTEAREQFTELQGVNLQNFERAEKAEQELHETNNTAKTQASVIRNLRQENKRLREEVEK